MRCAAGATLPVPTAAYPGYRGLRMLGKWVLTATLCLAGPACRDACRCASQQRPRCALQLEPGAADAVDAPSMLLYMAGHATRGLAKGK
jgi:hypothetical protein